MPTLNTKVRSHINAKMFDKPCREAERQLAKTVLKDMDPFVPKNTGKFAQSGHIIKGNVIEYPGPFARSLYFGLAVVEPKPEIVGFPVPGGGFRSFKGVKKHLSKTKKLHYKSGQAHWFAAAKDHYFVKWMNEAQKETATYAERFNKGVRIR